MTGFLLQTVLTLLACVALFFSWRKVSSHDRTVFWAVTLGVLGRAVGGVAAFFISYFGLPVGRSLQLGNGLWVMAIDAIDYVETATAAAKGGPMAIVHISKFDVSPFYSQILSTGFLLFGSVASVAILINIAAYLGCCAIIWRLGSNVNRRAAVVAITVLSLAPSAVIWSLQPLKDVPFLFLLAIFFGLAHLWQQLWTAEMPAGKSIALATAGVLAMGAVIYGISGIRWYFGFVLAALLALFVLLTVIRGPRRLAAATTGIALVALAVASFFYGAGPYVPPPLREAILGKSASPTMTAKVLVKQVNETRTSFDRVSGASIIGAGGAVSKIDRSLGVEEKRVAAVAGYQGKRSLSPEKAVQPQRETAKPAAAQPQHETAKPAAAQPQRETAKPPAAQPQRETTKPPAAQPQRETAKPPAAQPQRESAKPPAAPPASTAAAPAPPVKVAAPSAAATAPAKAAQVVPAPAPAPPAPAVVVPASPITRLIAGTAALVLPRFVAQRLHLVNVGGGRGMWLLVEIDTLFFDAVLVFCAISIIRAFRRGLLRSPVFWLVFIATGSIGLTLTYSVSNFGTLFRHRDMILFGLLLLPLVTASARQPGVTGEQAEVGLV